MSSRRTPTDSSRPLSDEGRRILKEVAAQLTTEALQEALPGFRVQGDIRHTKLARWGPTDEPETFDVIFRPESDHDAEEDPEEQSNPLDHDDLIHLLSDSEYTYRELPPSVPNEIHIQAIPVSPATVTSSPLLDADLVLQRRPARVLRTTMQLPLEGRMMRALWEIAQVETAYTYVNDVPMRSTMNVRMRSRGLGRFRWDMETVVTLTYTPPSHR